MLIDQVLYLPEYKVTLHIKERPSHSAIVRKMHLQDMFDFVCGLLSFQTNHLHGES